MSVSIGCRNQQNCPAELRGTTVSATLSSKVVAQRSCGEVSIDVGLQGSLRTYDSPSFTSQALAFSPGQ